MKSPKLEIRQDPTELRCKALVYQYEYEPREFASVWFAREMNEEHAKWVLLAQQAEDIMLRRGWVPSLGNWGETWNLGLDRRSSHKVKNLEEAMKEQNKYIKVWKWAQEQNFKHPFVCLVESDKWYKENVEKK